MIGNWLVLQKVKRSQTGHEAGLQSGMPTGGSQMTTAPQE